MTGGQRAGGSFRRTTGQVRSALPRGWGGGYICDRGLYSLLLRQLSQVTFLVYMTGGEGSNVGES